MKPLPDTVYTTRYAVVYHATTTCRRLVHGQNLSDADCGCDTPCNHRMPRPHPVRAVTPADAHASGRWPCLACCIDGDPVVGGPHLVLPPSTENFGHEPLEHDGFVICKACGVEYADYVQTIAWPCTSAIVLGLVPRPATGQE